MEKDLILIRGVSNAGKSTLAKIIAVDTDFVFSADDYFMKDGKYKFDGSKLKEAHAECQTRTELVMSQGYGVVFVANTFTQVWEMKAYFDLAKKYGYRVHSVIVENRHSGKNEHNVPDETIEAMKKRFEIQL